MIVLFCRFMESAEGELLIENVIKGDAGSYECIATRGREEAVAFTDIKIAGNYFNLSFICTFSIFRVIEVILYKNLYF